MRLRTQYTLLGICFGLGAPLGSLAFRMLTTQHSSLLSVATSEWQAAAYYYIYMTVATAIAFGLFGFILGRRDENLNALSITDGLTGLYNHRYLQEQLASEIQRADRYHTPLTCLMLDIDDFKKVNDQYGHPFGDDVLTKTAQLICAAVRRTDVVGRYGGEEFLVIMPQTSNETAAPLAERILKAMRDCSFSIGEKSSHVTLSIGLATYPNTDFGVKSKSALLSAADQALYKAKRLGKNQAVIWQP